MQLSSSGHWGLKCESGGLVLANGLQPVLLIGTPRRGPDTPGIQPLSEPSQGTAQ